MDRTPAYVADMVDCARELVALVQGLSLDAFLADRIRCLAVEKLFINLGEAARRIDPERSAAIAGVPWARVVGLRNILAHGYEQIDHEILYRTVVAELPVMMRALEDWLASQPAP